MAEIRTLILMRHASAGHQGGTRDHDRPLTAGGLREAGAAGAWIVRGLPPVEAVLCSTATRTRQTLAATGISAPTTFAEELYGGGTDDILDLLADLPAGAGSVLVIGHAPGIPATAAELAATGSAAGEASRDDGRPSPDTLRHFAAGAVAVLRSTAAWSDLPDLGADLVSVYSPGG